MIVPNPPFETRIMRYGPAAIAEAAALIAKGQPVAVPTETVYGLGADATDAVAVARIYAAKGRPGFNPLIVHVPDLATAETIAMFDPVARALAEAFWPGPLTLVLPLRPDAGIAAPVTAGLKTIALRVPAHRAMRAVLAACGKPLAAPSANASGTISPTRAEHVAASLEGRIPLIIDDGPTEAGLESTIVMTVGGVRVLRPGPITGEMLSEALSRDAAIPGSATPSFAIPVGLRTSPQNKVIAPGQLESHYAPRKPVRLDVKSCEDDEWLIGFGPVAGDDSLSVSGDLTEAAAALFSALFRADAGPKPRIAVAPIPATGLGVAINDRLRRAAHRG